MDLGHADDDGIDRADVARDDRLERGRDVAPHQHRVDPRFRPRAVRAAPGDRDVEKRAARHHRTRADLELADGEAGTVVHAENRIARKLVEEAVLDHRLAAAEPLFGRLEDEMHGAVEIASLRELPRRAQQHRRVAVMTAGVHPALMLRAVRKAVRLADRQAVHVGPEPDRARRVADPQPADDPGLADPAMHLDAERLELGGDQIRGALFLEPELGVGMNIATPPGQLVVKVADFLDYRHCRRSPLARSGGYSRCGGAAR